MSEAAPDAYATLAGLITLLADSKATVKRLDELRRLSTETAEAQAKLVADREQHDRRVAELDAREAALKAREEVCATAEAEYFQQLPRGRFTASPNLEPGGRSHSGLTREAYQS